MKRVSREPAKKGGLPFSREAREPGEITGPAQETLKGEAGALERLYALVAPQLRALAHRHLQSKSALELSPEEVANMTIHAFARAADFDLRSREQFFEFADRQAAIIVELAAEGRSEEVDPLLGVSKGTRKAAALGQAIREINKINAELAHVLRSRYVLDLEQADLAALLGQPETAVRKRWETAEGLLSAKYKQIEARGQVDPGSLDTPSAEGYSGGTSLAPSSLPDDAEPPSLSPQSLEAVRQENARLRSELADARQRIAELESSAGDGPDSAASRSEILALLQPPSLDEVPLCTVTSFDDLWTHLELHYGKWLSHFGADRDSISLDHIRRHDPGFVKKLTHRISRRRARERKKFSEAQTPTLGQIIPTEADRGDLTLAGKTVEDLFDPANRDLAALVCGRLGRHLYTT